jgi:DNA-binding protein HU-beta
MGTVGKTELAKTVAEKLSIGARAAQEVIDATMAAISEHTGNGDTVRLIGFGSFVVKAHKARTARNPRTGEAVDVPESTKLSFKPSKAS